MELNIGVLYFTSLHGTHHELYPNLHDLNMQTSTIKDHIVIL